MKALIGYSFHTVLLFNVHAFCMKSPKTHLKTWVATSEHMTFECGSPKYTYTCVNIDFSLDVVTWPHVAEVGVNVAEGLCFFHFTLLFKSIISFHNTLVSFYCNLPRCWWRWSCDNGPSHERRIKASLEDLMMVEGPCIGVGPRASEICLSVKRPIISVCSAFFS